ncbi:hypothetical protein ACFVGN_06740 [Streptomyces sp. NPDC057757]|uniref:hypothetical protein n=1 Tax=Streptomyces sp. NPDC057757 TaxID=3346241 RepID=UPI003690C7CB
MRLRVLILLVVALLAATPHPAAPTTTLGTATESAPTAPAPGPAPAAEPDVLDTALRPPARQGHRPVTPLRPAPRTGADHPADAPRPHPVSAPPSHSPTLHALRCVVLRC